MREKPQFQARKKLEKRLEDVFQAFNLGIIDKEDFNFLAFDVSKKLDDLEIKDRASNILTWGKYYFPDKFTLDFCLELHEYLVSIADEPFTDTLAPRGHAKTTIKCFLIPLFYALNEPDKFRHYVNIQSTATKAIAVNLSIREELEKNELLLRDYGDMVTKEKWTEKQFVLANGVVFTAVGAGESFRGKNYRNIRPDYIILDDLYDEDDMENPEGIAKKNRWFWGTIYKSTAIGKKTCIHIQGTAIHSSDLMHQLKKSSRWIFRKFTACVFETGYVLWKENNTLEKLIADREDMGSIIFNREMLNELRDDHASIIKSSYIQVIDELPAGLSFEYRVGAIDPAEKTKEINDYTAKVVLYVTKERDVYIVDIRNDKFTFHENKLDAIEMHQKHNLAIVPFETNKAYGLYEELQRTTGVPVRERITTKDKITRLISVSAFFENKKVFFVKKNIKEKLLTEAIEQCIYNAPTHDDIRDAIVLGLEEIKSLRHAFVG
jgi:predicted phage terminase large subunit-like protein